MTNKLLAPVGSDIALRETEKDLGDDRWFWIDDNAKALEAFLIPGVYEEYIEEVDHIVDFILNMSKSGLLLRRKSVDKLVVPSLDVASFKSYNGIMNYYGDLTQNKLFQGYRFHDGREVSAVSFMGATIKFQCRNQEFFLNGEDHSIEKNKITVEQKTLFGSKNVLIQYHHLFEDSEKNQIAEVIYKHTISDSTTVGNVQVEFKPLVSDDIKNLSIETIKSFKEEITYSKVCYKSTDSSDFSCYDSFKKNIAHKNLKYLSIIQKGKMGFSYAMHSMINDTKLSHADLTFDGDRVDKLKLVYKVDKINAKNVNIMDVSLLTAGGLYKTMPYNDIFDVILGDIKDKKSPGLIDYSISYDYGAELNSMASFSLLMSKKVFNISKNDLIRLEYKSKSVNEWCLKHLDTYIANFIYASNNTIDENYGELFVRGHSYVILSVIKMALNPENEEIIPDLTVKANLLLNALLGSQVLDENHPQFGSFPCTKGEAIFVDCSAAASLALSYVIQGYEKLNFKVSKNEILYKAALSFQAIKEEINITGNNNDSTCQISKTITTNDDGTLWNFKNGILLRAIHAFEYAIGDNSLQYMNNTLFHKIISLKGTCQTTLDYSKKYHKSGDLEYYTSFQSSETNSETQPWSMLGNYREYEDMYSSFIIQKNEPKKLDSVDNNINETKELDSVDNNINETKYFLLGMGTGVAATGVLAICAKYFYDYYLKEFYSPVQLDPPVEMGELLEV